MQFFSNLSSTFASLPPEKKKLLVLLGVVGTGLLLVMLFATISLSGSSSQQSVAPEESVSGTLPDTTKTPDEIVAMTQAPPQPTDILFFTKEDVGEFPPTPTPIPRPGNFYTPNGQQNDLVIRLYSYEEGATVYDVELYNTNTTELRTLGYTYAYAHGDSAFFSKDFSQVIFIGGPKNDTQKISFYSIPQNKIVKTITLDQIKKALPGVKLSTIAILSSMYASPDKSKVALSYGDTFGLDRITRSTAIIVINLSTNKMKLMPANGLVIGWKDNETIQYDVNAPDLANPNITQEIQVSGI